MRLFIVENDTGFGRRWVDILRNEGHTVKWCRGLTVESPRSVHEKGYDLALIDRRAKDDTDEDDISGEKFAVQLCGLGTPAVLVTAFLPPESRIFDLIRTGELTGVMSKKQDILPFRELIACVQQYAFSRRFPNGFAKFAREDDEETSSLGLWRSIRDRLSGLPEWTPPNFEEFAALFRSLVSPCATRIEFGHFSGGQSGAALVRTEASCGDGIDEDLAIKYGEKIAIRSEAMRYDRFVGPLPDGAATQLRWRAETETLGALAYSWVSDSLEDAIPFGELRSGDLPQLMWQRRRNAISRLFYVSLNRWYEIYRGPPNLERPKLLLDHYTGRGGVWYDETDLNHLELPPPDMPEALTVTSANGRWDFGEHGKLVDAVEWVTGGAGSRLKFNQLSPVHGDLHVANIFVLPDDSPRLIDFGRTGLGHIYRDFAALETSIRLTCIDDDDPQILKKAEDQICEAKTLGQYIDYRQLQGSADLKEAVQTTTQIRRAALDATSGQNTGESMQEYLFAVIIHMLRYATGIADEIRGTDDRKDIRVWHALYSAARAAEACG